MVLTTSRYLRLGGAVTQVQSTRTSNGLAAELGAVRLATRYQGSGKQGGIWFRVKFLHGFFSLSATEWIDIIDCERR